MPRKVSEAILRLQFAEALMVLVEEVICGLVKHPYLSLKDPYIWTKKVAVVRERKRKGKREKKLKKK